MSWSSPKLSVGIVVRLISVFLLKLFFLAGILTPIQAVESHAVVLMYHRFGEDKYPTTNIKTEQFIAQLDFLQNNDFHIWPLDTIIFYLQNDQPLPDKTVAITIDDAYLSVYQIAYPLMLERNIPFTVFVATGVIDQRIVSYMSWAQLKDMVYHNVSIGNHSVSHSHLIDNDQSMLVTEAELRSAELRIFEMLALKTHFFAYPYGEFNLKIAALIKQYNYVAFAQHSGPIGEQSDFRFLPRFPVSEQYADMNQFQTKLMSLVMPVANIQPESSSLNVAIPQMKVTLATEFKNKQNLNCFVSQQGRANVRWLSNRDFIVRAKAPVVLRRSRYNCTLKDELTGRYYWLSRAWFNANIPEKTLK